MDHSVSYEDIGGKYEVAVVFSIADASTQSPLIIYGFPSMCNEQIRFHTGMS